MDKTFAASAAGGAGTPAAAPANENVRSLGDGARIGADAATNPDILRGVFRGSGSRVTGSGRDEGSALRQPAPITACAFVRALPPAMRYVLRGNPQVMSAAGTALGLSISQTACRSAVVGELAALWLGPDEQLLLAPDGSDLTHTLTPALRDLSHSLVEVSHRQIALEVSGPHATALLNAGCPLDLDPSAFPVGMCTRTVLAKAEIVLWRTANDTFHIEVWRSFAAYVSQFLAEVAREVPFLTPADGEHS